MANRLEQDREDYYRAVYRLPEGERIPQRLWERAQTYLRATQARIARTPGRLSAFTPFSDTAQRAYLRQQYGEAPPRGLGVRQGEYVTVGADEVNEDRRIIATDFLMDCHALVLVARDSSGRVQRTLLAHMDSMTDVPNIMPALLARMPQGSRVEATIIGSTQGANPYLHNAILEALSGDTRIQRIRENVDVANTVAVDTNTGRILTAAPSYERLETAGKIEPSEIPIHVEFSPLGNSGGLDVRRMLYFAFREGNPVSSMGLVDAWSAGNGFAPYDATTRYINTLIDSDDGLTPDELQSINAQLSETLRQPVTLSIGPAPVNDSRATISVRNVGGAELGTFVSNILPSPAMASVQNASLSAPSSN